MPTGHLQLQSAFAPLLNVLNDDPYIPLDLPDPIAHSTLNPSFLNFMMDDSLPPPSPRILDPPLWTTLFPHLRLAS